MGTKGLMDKLFHQRLRIIEFHLHWEHLETLFFDSAFSSAFDMQIPSKGDLVKGETSGALGSILQVSIEDVTGDTAAGSFAGSDAEGYIYFIVCKRNSSRRRDFVIFK